MNQNIGVVASFSEEWLNGVLCGYGSVGYAWIISRSWEVVRRAKVFPLFRGSDIDPSEVPQFKKADQNIVTRPI